MKKAVVQKNSKPTNKYSGFEVSKIVIIQSLESHEAPTGEILEGYLNSVIEGGQTGLSVVFKNCEYAGEFIALVDELANEARASGAVPILHIECHGDKELGLEFANSSILSWEQIYDALAPLNSATGCNLLVVFSACFGAQFLSQMGVINPSPCFSMVGPSEEVEPSEIMMGFREFYRSFLTVPDLHLALSILLKLELASGKWVYQTAEEWFENLFISYLRTYCTKEEVEKTVRRNFRKLKKSRIPKSIGRIKREFRKYTRNDAIDKYYSRYFHLMEFPDNHLRFENCYFRVKKEMEFLRFSKPKRYIL